ncbi:MAG: TIGR03618 family F420-dependent PPOX class oxidoreductase [Candidatus Dormibacteraceae bacterium]
MSATVPASHADLLERPLIATFATVRLDGAPQLNPMWFLWDAENQVVKMTHTRVRSNYRMLQQEKRVALCIVDPQDDQRYLSLRGSVSNIEDDPEGSFYKRLQVRYRGNADEVVADRDVRVVLTVIPESVRVK